MKKSLMEYAENAKQGLTDSQDEVVKFKRLSDRLASEQPDIVGCISEELDKY